MTLAEAIKRYAGFFVASLYLIVGVIVLSKSNQLASLPDGTSLPLGILLVVYGLFRGYRVYQQYFLK